MTDLILAYKNFGANKHISHIGLGVAAINTCKVLRRAGIKAKVLPIGNSCDANGKVILPAQDLANYLEKHPAKYVAISAPFIPTMDLALLSQDFSETEFAVICHSNVGFLQADRNGVMLLKQLTELELASHNFHLAANSKRFCNWIHHAFRAPCTWLPNLYYLDKHAGHIHAPPIGTNGPVRIGIFGATRPLKNLMTAAAAALEIAESLRIPLELWLSAGRSEGGGNTVLDAVVEMLRDIPGVEVKWNNWQPWPKFRQTVSHMHLLMQPSYTESFNMVTADGIAEGVASVVSSAVDWAPDDWKADVDNASDIARTGRRLLHDQHAAHEGLEALKRYISEGIGAWLGYLRYLDRRRHGHPPPSELDAA